MVVAQQGHYIFGVCALGEPGEAAQVAEERGNLTAVAFKLLLGCQMRRLDRLPAEAGSVAAAHALDFAHLIGDAVFEVLIQLHHLVCSLAVALATIACFRWLWRLGQRTSRPKQSVSP